MKSKIGDPQRLAHIKQAIEEIEEYLKDVDFEIFCKSSLIRFASIKQMEIIGEAARHLSEDTKTTFQDVSWKEITGLRNTLVHEYFGVDVELVWQIITIDIPDLKAKLFNNNI